MVERAEVSFCATNLNTIATLPSSLESVEVLGSALGVPFEVIVADGPSSEETRTWLEQRARTDPRLTLVMHDLANRGRGRRLAFEASVGSTIVPFDTSLVYDPQYAGLLRGYLRRSTDAMLFSEICALARRAILAVGGWRDLIGGEDLDLYARIVRRYGLLAYPTATRNSHPETLGSYSRQMRYASGGRFRRWRRIYAVQRDQIIGANYRVSDLMGFNATKPWSRRVAYGLFFTIAYLGARASPLDPYDFSPNNYLIVREAILRSLVERSYESLEWSGPTPTLLLSEDEVTYLSKASDYWRSHREAVVALIDRK